MIETLAAYISENPMVAIGLVGVFIALNSLMLARWQRHRVFNEEIERSSNFQISENLKDIERVLNQEIGAAKLYSLQDILDGNAKPDCNAELEKQLSILAPYFSEFAANLDKYSSNVMRRKKPVLIFKNMAKRQESTTVFFRITTIKILV